MSKKNKKSKFSIIEPTVFGVVIYMLLSIVVILANSGTSIKKINIHLSNTINGVINYSAVIVFVLFIVSVVYLTMFEMIRLVENVEYNWSIRKKFKHMSAKHLEKMLFHQGMRFVSRCIIGVTIVLYVFKVVIPLVSGSAIGHLFTSNLMIRGLQFILLVLVCHGLTILLRLFSFRNRLALSI